LSTVLELSSESGLSEDGFPTSETIQTNKSSEIDYYDDPAIIQYIFLSDFVPELIFQESGHTHVSIFERSSRGLKFMSLAATKCTASFRSFVCY
jgi:hypothetical protein